MADDTFIETLRQASNEQEGFNFLLIYYILNPKVYNGEIKLTAETEIITFYPVGTYQTFSDAFKVLKTIMEKIDFGRFKIIQIGTSSSLTNTPTKSILNSMWDKLPADKLEALHLAEQTKAATAAKEDKAPEYDVNNPDSIEYLRDNFSNLCFNTYALQRCDEQHQQIIEAIEMRRANCWKYLANHSPDDFDTLLAIYQERLPKRGESQLIRFFTNHITDKIDGIPQILHKNEAN